MAKHQLETSEGIEFEITIGNSGTGFLHSGDNCEKVRITNWELDNEDGLYWVHHSIEEEFEKLVDKALNNEARAWVETEYVKSEVQKLKELELRLTKIKDEAYLKQKEIKDQYNKIFRELYYKASDMGGFDSLKGTWFGCCHSTEHNQIEVGNFRIREM